MSRNVVPIERAKTLRDQAADYLRSAIIEAKYEFGTLLSESVLAELLGISKTPIHEALVLLQGEGLVEILPQRGAQVFQPTEELVQDLCDFRILIEVRAAVLSHQRNKPKLIAHLRDIVASMNAAWARDDNDGYLRLDTAYHDAFFTYSESRTLRAAAALVGGRAAAIRTQLVINRPVPREVAYREHMEMLELLEGDRVDAAVTTLRHHVSRLMDLFHDHPRTQAP